MSKIRTAFKYSLAAAVVTILVPNVVVGIEQYNETCALAGGCPNNPQMDQDAATLDQATVPVQSFWNRAASDFTQPGFVTGFFLATLSVKSNAPARCSNAMPSGM
jgi:hypothetical protein